MPVFETGIDVATATPGLISILDAGDSLGKSECGEDVVTATLGAEIGTCLLELADTLGASGPRPPATAPNLFPSYLI